MTFLYVLLSIIAAIILLLCIRVVAVLNYNEYFNLNVRWLFLKFQIYPKKEKHEEKANKEKKDEPKDKKKKKESKNKSNPLKEFYENQGFNGVLELIGNASSAVTGMLKRIMKAIVINDLNLGISVSGSDSASTAIDYGETCAKVYPAMGAVCSTMNVRKYEVDIKPDFINGIKKAQFNVVISVIPIRIINAALILVVQLLFKVLLKLFLGSRKLKIKNR